MPDSEIKEIHKDIISNNYLSNCYRHLTRSKIIHFLIILIEVIFNIIQELDIYLRDFHPANNNTKKNKLSFIFATIQKTNSLKQPLKLIIMVFFVLIMDLLYIFLKKKNFLIRHTYNAIILNILELIYFRIFVLIFFELLFTLTKYNFLIGFIIFLPHIYLTIKNFLYNHLYYFVPDFIDYPYDEFTSLFDIILFFCKILISISGTSDNEGLGKFFFIILFILQIFFSIYLIEKLINHSYLFMKNSFLNKTKLCLFLEQSLVITFALLIGKTEVLSILFVIVCIGLLLNIMGYLYFIYNPYSFIKIRRETPMENIYFYLYILSNKNFPDFLFEDKVNEHYEQCGICELCKKYLTIFKKYENNNEANENEEKENLLNSNKDNVAYEKKCINKNQLIDLFFIIYDGENKYFQLVKKMIINYEQKGKDSFTNNSHYYVNLSFLMYSDYENNNITLSLNEKLILEMLNLENHLILDNHQSQIIQLLLCNKFMELSMNVIKKLKDILNSEQNLNKAKKLIELSFMLKKMKNKKYKKNLFSHKLENISNSRNLISLCSIIYEEIFNTTINNSQIPIRENIQPLEDFFRNASNKNDKVISLALDLNSKNCKIVRAGKGLSSFLNYNLFDLFPLIFQQYQINLFVSSVLSNFDNSSNKEKKTDINNSIVINKKNKKNNAKLNIKNTKVIRPLNNSNKSKKEYVEIKLIFCEDISLKIYYKLLTIKITPLFNNDNNYFILFDGLFYIHKLTIISIIDYEKNKNSEEKVFGVSEPELEKGSETYCINLKKYSLWQSNQGYNMNKVSSFNICFKLYSIYMLIPKDKEKKKKLESHMSIIKEGKLLEEYDEQNSAHKNTRIEKINLMEDNASVTSQQTSNSHEKGLSSLGFRNKKKDNYYEYNSFHKLQKIIYISIVIILIIIIFEYIHLNSLKNSTKKNNESYLEFREFYKLYFQLFSLTLSVACIQKESQEPYNCINIIKNYTEIYYYKLYPASVDEYFDFNKLLQMQSEILGKKMMNQRSFMNNIHRNIGNSNYNKIFGKFINYSRVSQSFFKNYIKYDIIEIDTQFSEAILIMCNSFKVLTEANDTKSIIYFLNKTDDPFSYLNNIIIDKELLSYQKEFYEMILNYKIYSSEFDSINDQLKDHLIKNSYLIEICIYIYLNLDTIMILFIAGLIYLYVKFFETIIIKILNYINMTMTVNENNFNFNEIFTKKLDNLEIILQLYKGDPLQAVQKLNIIYNEYQQHLTTKNKNEAIEMSRKGYRKNSEDETKKDEIDNIPKNQRIINKKEIRDLNVVSKYFIFFYIVLLITLILYVILLILWINYFELKRNLISLTEKNYYLEESTYRAINIYNLMIFNNLTLPEISEYIYPYLYNKEEDISIIKIFYENLKYAFNNKKEKDFLGTSVYVDIEDNNNFTCENLYELNNDFLKEINQSSITKKPNKIKENLIKACNNSKVADSNDPRAAFERHFQYIKNGLISIDDFSYEGLIYHLSGGSLGNIALFFNIVITYLLETLFFIPHKKAIITILKLLNKYILITEIVFIVIDIIFIIIILFFFISKIKNYCNQILLLKNTFKIFEIQEQ